MRDRLSDLQEVQAVDLDSLSEHDATSPHDQELRKVLQEAEQIQQDILQIQKHISQLQVVNYQTLNQTSHQEGDKQDSNTIGADIRHAGERVVQRLHSLKKVSDVLESQHGRGHPATRVALIQYQSLSQALQEVMASYSDTERRHQEACRHLIQRQLEVVGKVASEEELEEMLESPDWKVFSDQVEGKTARSALVQIESRHKDLLDLEKRMEQIQELSVDVAMLAQEQGAMVENIQKNVLTAEATVQEGAEQLERATASDRKNPCRQLFCSCFPCLKNL
ncbi:syntaxin-11-like [Synchiropus picturatus]